MDYNIPVSELNAPKLSAPLKEQEFPDPVDSERPALQLSPSLVQQARIDPTKSELSAPKLRPDLDNAVSIPNTSNFSAPKVEGLVQDEIAEACADVVFGDGRGQPPRSAEAAVVSPLRFILRFSQAPPRRSGAARLPIA